MSSVLETSLSLGKMKELFYPLTFCIPIYAEVAIFNSRSTEMNKYLSVLTLNTNMKTYLQLNESQKFKHRLVLKTNCSQWDYLL